jgi:hypothetical protein
MKTTTLLSNLLLPLALLCGCTADVPSESANRSAKALLEESPGPSVSDDKHDPLDHIFYIMMENHGTDQIIGNTADAPNINQLASKYGLATNYFGVTHPSLPNYLAAISGDFQGIWDDCKAGVGVTCAPEEFVPDSGDATATVLLTPAEIASSSAKPHLFDGANLVDKLEAKRLTWRAYVQSIPGVGSTVEYAPVDVVAGVSVPRKLYAQKHDPFMYFSDIRNDSQRMKRIVPFDGLAHDLAKGDIPNFVWISPDQCHDMHGVSAANAAALGIPDCASPESGLDHKVIALGDAFLKTTVDAIMHSRAWRENSAIVIAWDENDYSGTQGCCSAPLGAGGDVLGGGHAPALVITSRHARHQSVDTAYNHYSLLGTIQRLWDLDCLGATCAFDDAQLMLGLFNSDDVRHTKRAHDTLALSRVRYDGNTFGNTQDYPFIFSDPTVSGIQGSIFVDMVPASPNASPLRTLSLTGITTSFSSKSEGALMLSQDKQLLTYMGYAGPVGAGGVSNSYDTAANLAGNTNPLFDREVALIAADGSVSLTVESNAYSGDNPRAAITVDGTQFYMAGNADSTIANDGSGPGTTIGARYGTPGSPVSIELGAYFASDRPDESAKQHVKDSNFRAVGIFGGNLYVAKGSGGNGDDGVFQVQNGTGEGLPLGTGNTIVPLFSAPATDPVSKAPSPYTPFGFWFADPTTLYVADEGYANVDADGNLIPDPLAGIEKWSLVGGAWQLDYTLTAGLDLYQPRIVPDYPVATYTTGLRNMTGTVNEDGTVTLYAITAQFSSVSGGEPDPTRLVTVRDRLSAMSAPAASHDDGLGTFATLQVSKAGEVIRGVALAPGM